MLNPHLGFLKLNPAQISTKPDLSKLVANTISQKRPFANFDNINLTLDQINHAHSIVDFKVKYIVVLGIGGSSLGAKTLVETLARPGLINRKVFFIDSVDPDTISYVDNNIVYQNTLFFVVSNSGNTIETLAQAHYFLNRAQGATCQVSKQFHFILGTSESELFKLSLKHDCPVFNWPENICGRFSMFSIASLLPASFAGVDAKSILQHAAKLNLKYTIDNAEVNSALNLASKYHDYLVAGFNELVLFCYADKLQCFGQWAVQLISESLGKSDLAPTPIVARGVTDQHSSLQLFKQGPNNKFFLFIYPDQFTTDSLKIAPAYSKIPNYLDSETFQRLHLFEMQGTVQSLVEAQRPVATMSLDDFKEHQVVSLGMFFMYFTFYLSELLNCNCFDQPGVEDSKIITKQLLINNNTYNA